MQTRTRCLIVAAIAATFAGTSAMPALGITAPYDPNYGSSGTAHFAPPACPAGGAINYDIFDGGLTASDGSLYATTDCTLTGGVRAVAVNRLTPSGLVDSAFGTNGTSVIKIPPFMGTGTADLISGPSGRVFLVVADNAQVSVDNSGDDGGSECVVSLTPTGLRDLTYPIRCFMTSDTFPETSNMAVDANGRLIVVAQGPGAPYAYRFLPTGMPDPTFGWHGQVRLNGLRGPVHYDARLAAFALDQEDRILVGFVGDQSLINNTLENPAIAVERLTPSGALDTNFGSSSGVFGISHAPAGASEDPRFWLIGLPGGGTVVELANPSFYVEDFEIGSNGVPIPSYTAASGGWHKIGASRYPQGPVVTGGRLYELWTDDTHTVAHELNASGQPSGDFVMPGTANPDALNSFYVQSGPNVVPSPGWNVQRYPLRSSMVGLPADPGTGGNPSANTIDTFNAQLGSINSWAQSLNCGPGFRKNFYVNVELTGGWYVPHPGTFSLRLADGRIVAPSFTERSATEVVYNFTTNSPNTKISTDLSADHGTYQSTPGATARVSMDADC